MFTTEIAFADQLLNLAKHFQALGLRPNIWNGELQRRAMIITVKKDISMGNVKDSQEIQNRTTNSSAQFKLSISLIWSHHEKR